MQPTHSIKLMLMQVYSNNNLQALNELCENQAWDIEVTSGSIGQIDLAVPWHAFLTESTCVELSQVKLELRPKCRPKDGTSMIESMWSSMSSSMQLAKDCLDRDGGGTQIEAMERFAQYIDNSKFVL